MGRCHYLRIAEFPHSYTNQEQSSRKVPSVVYYNGSGDVIGAGANIPDELDELDDVVKAEQ